MQPANKDLILWQRIKGFRNRVAHEYVNIDTLIVFTIIKEELPELQLQIISCIKKQLQDKIFSREEIEISEDSIFYRHIDFSKLI